MATRVTDQDVADIMRDVVLESNNLGLTAQIAAANVLTNRVSSNDSNSLLGSNDLFEIERYLAAHFYTFKDQQFTQEITGDGQAMYQGMTEMGLDYSPYGQMAKVLDATGYLAKLDQQAKEGRKKVDVIWMGTEEEDDESREPNL